MITSHGLEKLGFKVNIDFKLQNDGDGEGTYIGEWLSEEVQPSDAEIGDATTEWRAETQHQRDRQYPELGEQLDILFHDMTAGKGTKDGEWYKAIAKVKTDNPKPTE
tara:strand:+ start:72 stop:392 length:321 start_codon:yes stop_codon:yes gene_type:complete